MAKIIIGTFFKTRKLAEAFIRMKRLKFNGGYSIVPIKDGFIVAKDKIVNGV